MINSHLTREDTMTAQTAITLGADLDFAGAYWDFGTTGDGRVAFGIDNSDQAVTGTLAPGEARQIGQELIRLADAAA
jgi:hypothetical protein